MIDNFMDPARFAWLLDIALEWGGRILLAVVIFFIGRYLARFFAKLIVRTVQRFNRDPSFLYYLENITYWMLLTAVLLAAVDQIGISVTSLLAVLAAAGLAVGLALRDSLSNVASGILLVILRPFTVNDYVTVAGVSGTVERIGLFNTHLQTPDNRLIIVPNAEVLGGHIINDYVYATRRVDIIVGISYGDDIRIARTLLEDIMAKDERVLKKPRPKVTVAELGESSILLNVRPWVQSDEYWPLYWSLLETIKNEFDANGISLPYPQRDVHIHRDSEAHNRGEINGPSDD